MAIEGILAKIAEDARAEAARLSGDAEREIARIRQEGDERRRRIEREAEERASQEAEDRRKRLAVSLEREGAREILAEKQRLIESVFDRAREKIASLDAGAYRDLAVRLLREAARDGNEEVILPEGDDRIGADLVARVNKELGQGGKKGGLRIASERRPIGGGFILRSGRRETNCTIEAVLGTRRDELETLVARILFGESGGAPQ